MRYKELLQKGITGNDKYDKLLRTLRLRKYF